VSIEPQDLRDAGVVDAVELASAGAAADEYLSGSVVSVVSGLVTVSAMTLVNPDEPLENLDIFVLSGATAGDGAYTVDTIDSGTTFTVNESIADSTGGSASFRHPAGATKVGVDPTNLSQSEQDTLQGVMEDIDTAVSEGGFADEHVKVSGNDTTAGYLGAKLVEGTGITLTEQNDGGNETLKIDAEASSDELVGVSADDTDPGYLEDKIVEGPGIKLTTLDPGGDESLEISSGKVIACSWGTNATAYIYAYSSGAWAVMARIVFPGSDHMQATVEAIKAVLWVSASNRIMDIRVYDLTNDLVVAESDDLTNEDPELIDFGTVSNVPTGPAIWELQGHKDGNPAGFIYLSALTIFFED